MWDVRQIDSKESKMKERRGEGQKGGGKRIKGGKGGKGEKKRRGNKESFKPKTFSTQDCDRHKNK